MQSRPDALVHRLDARVKVEAVSGVLPWAAWQARRCLERLRPDVAHAHLSGGCRALKGLRHRCLRLATLHIRYKTKQHAHLDALIALTPDQLEEVPETLRARSRQIDNWTQATKPSDEMRRRQRAAWGIADDVVLIGTLGRTELSKGHDVLLKACAPLLDDPRVRLVIVGGGRDWPTVRRLADPRVLMPGFSADPAACFAAFDLFVSAARSEPFGLVFLEAMQARLPIVATASEGARYLGPRHGWTLVPVDDADALRDALRDQLQRGVQARDYAMEAYSLAHGVAQVEAFYREGLARLAGVETNA
jgi:glycosyltransferase involved in cell wall biosynthesis